jgi:hypothetical protein
MFRRFDRDRDAPNAVIKALVHDPGGFKMSDHFRLFRE